MAIGGATPTPTCCQVGCWSDGSYWYGTAAHALESDPKKRKQKTVGVIVIFSPFFLGLNNSVVFKRLLCVQKVAFGLYARPGAITPPLI